MISNDAELLSIDTMPYFIKLISLYNKSVEDLTAIFRVQKDEAAFSKLLDYLVNDFEYTTKLLMKIGNRKQKLKQIAVA